MVTVRPNFQDSVHVGLVTGLKKFTQYLTSVLCFTTPGDGPRSPARAVRTHEDGGWLRVAAENFLRAAFIYYSCRSPGRRRRSANDRSRPGGC